MGDIEQAAIAKVKALLRPEQLQHLESTKWLFNEIGNRQAGRSYTIAVALIILAMENPKRDILYSDHFPGYISRASENLRKCIQEIVGKIEEKPTNEAEFKKRISGNYGFVFSRDKFRYDELG